MGFTDPDGPGPFTYTVGTPLDGTVTGTAPDLTYTPDAGFIGDDSFTWSVDDSLDGSNIATIAVSVARLNLAPVANDDQASTTTAVAVVIDVLANDTDGDNDPLTVQGIVAQPGDGAVLVNGDNTITYTPNASFTGVDTFSYSATDGQDSDTADVQVAVSTSGDLFNDDFNRPDGSVVGNGWSEGETSGTAVGIAASALAFTQFSDVANSPMASHTFPRVSSGELIWEFDFNWARTGSEGTYQVFMQLGDGALMTSSSQAAGIGVNLIWTRIAAVHQTLGHRQGGVNAAIAGLSGLHKVTVTANLETFEFAVAIDDVIIQSNLPFDENVEVDTVRFFTDGLNHINFSGRSFDDLLLQGLQTLLVANDDTATTDRDKPTTIAVLGNDVGWNLVIDGVTTPSNGSVLVQPDETVEYTPAPEFVGADSFTYVATDGPQSDSATVSVTVLAPNNPPVANDDVAVTPENTPVDIGVLANDTDPDTDADSDPLVVDSVSNPPNGTTVVNADQTVRYTPDLDFFGVDTFTYFVNDGRDVSVSPGTVTVTVTEVNVLPVANDDADTTIENTSIHINVLANDTDADGDPLQVDSVTDPPSGTAVVDVDGTILYTPDLSFVGIDSFSYTVSDGLAVGALPATVTVTVNAQAAPIADDQSLSTAEGVPLGIVLTFTDPDGPGPHMYTVGDPGSGTISGIPPDITYTPDVGFNGQDSFAWSVNDGVDESNVATISVLVTAPNDGPLFSDDFEGPDSSVVGNGWDESEAAGATVSIAGNALEFTATSDATNRPLISNTFQKVSNGQMTWEFDFNWTRSGNEGTYRLFMQLGDGATMSTTSQDAGVGVNLIWTKFGGSHEQLGYRASGANTALTGLSGVHAVAVTADLDLLSYEVAIDNVVVQSGIPFDGAVDIDTVKFFTDGLHHKNFSGRTFDNVVVYRQAQVIPVVANADSATTDESTPVNIDVLANDVGSVLTIQSVSQGTNGSVIVQADETVDYTRDPGFFGDDSFTYTATDGLTSDTATVDVTVLAVSSVDAVDDTASTDEGVPVEIDVLANDSDDDGDPLIVDSVTQPTNGAVVVNFDQTVTYSPSAGFSGGDTFTYIATDGVDTDTATVIVTVVGGELFSDNFDRPNSGVVGNGWTEAEGSGTSVGIVGNTLTFSQTSDASNRPLVTHAFPKVTSGQVTWSFDFN